MVFNIGAELNLSVGEVSPVLPNFNPPILHTYVMHVNFEGPLKHIPFKSVNQWLKYLPSIYIIAWPTSHVWVPVWHLIHFTCAYSRSSMISAVHKY